VLHGFFEAYGRGAGSLVARYEIAADPDGPALLSARVAGETPNEERAIFTHMMPVRQLPPGRYVLRARLVTTRADARDDADDAITTLTREFEVGAPAVLLTSAEAGAARRASGAAEIFLPVEERLFQRPFIREEATRSATQRAFRDRAAPAAREAFDKGVSALAGGRFEDAQSSFKSVIDVDADTSAPLAYLGATYASVGLDAQAAGAWQTALIEGADMPQIYVWLGDALLRTRDLTGARAILEEATKKWPSDVRFAKPLALIYATFGQGREAVRTLERHLEASPNDAEALALGVEWIYHLQLAGAVARTRAEDLRLARRYADAYQRTKGPQAALIREWMGAMERLGGR
jgi:tetratricopeptide (TPR) repeat protein